MKSGVDPGFFLGGGAPLRNGEAELHVPAEHHGYNFLGNLSMLASADGSVWAIFLGEKLRGNVAFGNLRFSGGKSY